MARTEASSKVVGDTTNIMKLAIEITTKKMITKNQKVFQGNDRVTRAKLFPWPRDFRAAISLSICHIIRFFIYETIEDDFYLITTPFHPLVIVLQGTV